MTQKPQKRPFVLSRSAAFFAVILVPVVYLHLAEAFLWSEAVDGVVSALAFTVPFAVGAWVAGCVGFLPSQSRLGEGLAGAALALVMWALLWTVWHVVPEAFYAAAEAWAFYSHLAVALGFGLLSGIGGR